MEMGTSAQLRTKVQDLWNKRPHYVTPTLTAIAIIMTIALIWQYGSMRFALSATPFLIAVVLHEFKQINKKMLLSAFALAIILVWSPILSIVSVFGKDASPKPVAKASIVDPYSERSAVISLPSRSSIAPAKEPLVQSAPVVPSNPIPPNILPENIPSTDGNTMTDNSKPTITESKNSPKPTVVVDDSSRGVEATLGDLTIRITSCKHMLNAAIECIGQAQNNGPDTEELSFKEGGSALDDIGNFDDLPLRRNGITFGITGTVQMPSNTHVDLRLQFRDGSSGRSTGLQSITLHARWNGVYGNMTLPAIPIS